MTDWCHGMKAVCIHPGPWTRYNGDIYLGSAPQKDKVYTVKQVYIPDAPAPQEVHLRLYEIGIFEGQQYGFAADVFRPVREHKNDISALRKLVEPKALTRCTELIKELLGTS